MIDFKPTAFQAPRISESGRRRALLASLGLAAVLAASAAAVFAGLRNGTVSVPATAATSAVPVSVAMVHARDIQLWNEFSGRLEAVNRVDIRPRAAGAVIATHFREGAMVKQGDLLFTIDPAPYIAEVDRLQAQVAAAAARLALAARDQTRGLSLGRSYDLAQRDVDQRVNEYQAASANLHAAQAELETAKLNLGYTDVRAPISGRIGKIEVTPGNLVPAGSGAPILTTLVSVNPIYASFDADETSVARAIASLPPGGDLSDKIGKIPVRMGTLATDGAPVEGHLQLIDNRVDTSSGTVRVRAAFDNTDGSLMPGQFARLRLGQATRRPVIAIDEQAIGTDQDRRFVMVVADDDTVAYRAIHLGGEAEGERIVTDGLTQGERIVVDGLQRVRPGAHVAPHMVAMTEREPDSFASR